MHVCCNEFKIQNWIKKAAHGTYEGDMAAASA